MIEDDKKLNQEVLQETDGELLEGFATSEWQTIIHRNVLS